MKKILMALWAVLLMLPLQAAARETQNFNGGWLLTVGDWQGASETDYDDSGWSRVTLPHAFNEREAYRVSIEHLTDTVVWYRKHFNVGKIEGKKYFIEFEGVRFGAEFWINGHSVGLSENGVMASGYDLTPYLTEGENVIAVRCDNDWSYRERSTGQRYQWNDRNFNANYGGIPKNVWLHVTGEVYQTLPLFSSLQTTGTYVYGSHYDVAGRKVTVNIESQVRNEARSACQVTLQCIVTDKVTGREVLRFTGESARLQAGETRTLKAQSLLRDAHFWSWGYGYLYDVRTQLVGDGGAVVDDVHTVTGFRATHFGEGKIWLNDRVMMVHGYAQRTSNEWPGVGIDVPAWLSDYSNRLMVQSGGNMVRWMHVTPSKQDIMSCDRVGLPEAMPAGDAEHDVTGRRWEQRKLLMRDAIIYNRNNPSILFYEGGNESISREHMLELRAIRDQYDPQGGRAIGSREMLDIDEAEYGGEMLYINKSRKHPMFAMEYCRDEALRKYWDEYSYPFHKEGDGPLYRGKPAHEYNHNQDNFAVELVKRWDEYHQERPGTGRRVSVGGVKIVFSDTNTHHRGEANYRTSGVTDAMRIPKDGYFAHQVMWDGWVEPERDRSHIVGHWNYPTGTVKPVYVVSTGDEVELRVNGKSMGKGTRSNTYLFTFPKVAYEAGTIVAISYRNGREVSRDSIETAGAPHHLRLTAIQNPLGFKADGADEALIEVEMVDKEGRRCPLDNSMVRFQQWGEGQWLGGIALRNAASKSANTLLTEEERQARKASGLLDASDGENTSDNYIGAMTLPLECGVNRVLLRSTTHPGTIHLAANVEGFPTAMLELTTEAVDAARYNPAVTLPPYLERGETPATPSYRDTKQTIGIASVQAGSNRKDAQKSIDDNELSEWKSDGTKANAWIDYTLEKKSRVDEVVLKLTGWRSMHYPLAIYADGRLVWKGVTTPSLGYVHINIGKPVVSRHIRIGMLGPATAHAETGDTKELAGGKAGELDRLAAADGQVTLRIVEADLLQNIR